jgi:hypothetical protein
MAYDFHGYWEGKTDHIAPLYSSSSVNSDDLTVVSYYGILTSTPTFFRTSNFIIVCSAGLFDLVLAGQRSAVGKINTRHSLLRSVIYAQERH